MWDEKIMDNLMFPFGFSNAERLLVIPPWQFLYSYSRILDKCLSSVGIHRLGGGGKGRGGHFVSHALNMSIAFLIVGKG